VTADDRMSTITQKPRVERLLWKKERSNALLINCDCTVECIDHWELNAIRDRGSTFSSHLGKDRHEHAGTMFPDSVSRNLIFQKPLDGRPTESRSLTSIKRHPLATADYGWASGTRTRIALSTRTISLENFSLPTFRIDS
jgi:hypothetical protein